MLGILTTGCSRKIAPTISLPSEKTPCDDAIQALLDSVQSVEPTYIYDFIVEKGQTDTVCIIDSSNCNYFKTAALELASKYNLAIKERDYYKALAQSQAKKIINNNYINSKNKNTQIGDGNVQQEKNKGPAVNGNENVTPVKPKGSAIGPGSSVDNSKKGLNWWWILFAGYLLCHVIHKILIPAAMRFIPFANIAHQSTRFIKNFKFWT